MPKLVNIAISDLLIDHLNARLVDEQHNQADAILALAKQQKSKIIALARHIVSNGIDPLTITGIVAADGEAGRYWVAEGNRRAVAIKALENPTLVDEAYSTAERKELRQLSEEFAEKPIEHLQCMLFSDDERPQLDMWIRLRHTGANNGAGLVEWGADEQDRNEARHGDRSVERQVLDFVEQSSAEGAKLVRGKKVGRGGIITSLKRLLGTPEVREQLGITIIDGKVLRTHGATQVLSALTKVVKDLAKAHIKVDAIYTKTKRQAYAKQLAKQNLIKGAPLANPKALDDKSADTGAARIKGAPKGRPRKDPRDRLPIIPKVCALAIGEPRVKKIEEELRTLDADKYPNACSVLLRVFVELSVDHALMTNKLATDDQRRSWPLAKRLKMTADNLLSRNLIDAQLKAVIYKIADSDGGIAPTMVTFHQFVHNKYSHPKPSELRTGWDEMERFVAALWP